MYLDPPVFIQKYLQGSTTLSGIKPGPDIVKLVFATVDSVVASHRKMWNLDAFILLAMCFLPIHTFFLVAHTHTLFHPATVVLSVCVPHMGVIQTFPPEKRRRVGLTEFLRGWVGVKGKEMLEKEGEVASASKESKIVQCFKALWTFLRALHYLLRLRFGQFLAVRFPLRVVDDRMLNGEL